MLLKALQEKWYTYIAFTISFFSIFIIWVNHHKIFKQIYARNTAVMFANGLILFLASIVSFTTAILSRYYDTEAVYAATAIYTGLFVLINLSFNLLWWLASKEKKLLRPNITISAIRSISKNYMYGLPVHVIAFLCAFVYPLAALIICVSLWIFWAFTSGKVNLSKQ